MSKGLGKVQSAVLEYLRMRRNVPSALPFLKGPGWCSATEVVRGLYVEDWDRKQRFYEWVEPTPSQYNSVLRAIDQLAKMGLIQKQRSSRRSSGGKRRGPLRRNEHPKEKGRDKAGSYRTIVCVRLISVDSNTE